MKNESFEKQSYDKARANLLLMIILTVVNIALFFTGSETVMLFSATVPYVSVVFGSFCEFNILMYIFIALSFIIMLLYLLCWIFSKRSPIWMIIATVMFAMDTLALIGMYVAMQEISGVLDLLVHIWVLYYLIIGIKHGYALKKMGNLVDEDDTPTEIIGDSAEASQNTSPLYRADEDAKHRVLAEADKLGYYVCYRRVKKRNELVINNYVYDYVEMLIEPPHKLTATIDDHSFEAGYAGCHSYIRIDGELLVNKPRIW